MSYSPQSIPFLNRSTYAYPFIRFQLLIFLFGNPIEMYGGFYGHFRLAFIVAAISCLIFFSFIFEASISFIKQYKGWVKYLTIYFFLHPFLIITLNIIGIRQFPSGTSIISVFFSSLAWQTTLALVLIMLMHLKIKDFENIHRLIWRVSLIIAIESVVLFYLLHAYAISEISLNREGRFDSIIIQSNFFCGLLGFFLYCFSLYFCYSNQFLRKYKFGLILGTALTIASLERSIIAGLIIFNILIGFIYLLKKFYYTRPEVNVIKLVVISLFGMFLVIVSIFSLSHLRRQAFDSYSSLIDRIMMWGRGVEIGYYFFPIGCGGNLAGKYVVSSLVPPLLTEQLIKLNVPEDIIYTLKVSYSYIQGLSPLTRRSIHSVQVDLIAEFGLLGIIIVLALIYYPLIFLLKISKILIHSDSKEIMASTIYACFLLALQIPLSMASVDNILWIVIAFYIYFFKKYYIHLKQFKNLSYLSF